MFAIIRSGGKQYKVQPGDVIRVEKLEQALGSEFDLTEVLMVGGETTSVGTPVVKNAKVIIFKKKRRQGYRRFKTHRQHFTELFVKAISLDGKTDKASAAPQVVDVDQVRQDKIAARTVAKQEARKPETRKAATSAPKKVAKKAAAPKKAAAKKSAKKKAGAKKSAKKTAKKTSKKA
jgi:large subunit ribosomal protein L21